MKVTQLSDFSIGWGLLCSFKNIKHLNAQKSPEKKKQKPLCTHRVFMSLFNRPCSISGGSKSCSPKDISISETSLWEENVFVGHFGSLELSPLSSTLSCYLWREGSNWQMPFSSSHSIQRDQYRHE